uniref:Meckel syndrome type 1 protein n=1 Tax=Trichuris muris TaxID=70415 RepID=A0A5S6QIJ4_TRIMR
MEPHCAWTYLLPCGKFRIKARVRLEKAYSRLSSSALDKSAKPLGTKPALPTNESSKAGVSSGGVEEYTFHWFEEKRLWNFNDEPGTSAEAVHEISQDATHRLFSITHADVSGDSTVTECCKSRCRQFQRRNDKRETRRCSGQAFPSSPELSIWQTPVLEMPVRNVLIRGSAAGNSSIQRMSIMAYLGDLNSKQYDAKDEVVLCTLELIDDCYLRVTPDFNDQIDRPYLIYGRTGTYYYVVQDVSEVTEEQGALGNANAKSDLSRLNALRLSYDFDIPAERRLRIFVFGEIESAIDFEYNNLFIEFCLETPKGWKCHKDKCSGVTQLCSSTHVPEVGKVSYFGMPLEFELSLDLGGYAVSEEHPEWPLLFIAVMSLDNLSRYRLEGYGFVELPRVPGREQCIVRTWRPIEEGAENLQRFFLGGSTQLESITLSRYVKSLKNEHGRKKIQLKTVSGGNVKINFYSVHQCREFAGSCKESFIRYGSLPHGLRPSLGWNTSILQVLEAFQRARQKMITARQRVVREWHLRLSKAQS